MPRVTPDVWQVTAKNVPSRHLDAKFHDAQLTLRRRDGTASARSWRVPGGNLQALREKYMNPAKEEQLGIEMNVPLGAAEAVRKCPRQGITQLAALSGALQLR